MKVFFGLLVLFACLSVSAQNTHIYIYDSTGNTAQGSINNGNVYFSDKKGNTTFGTIRNGNVFLNGSNGEVTFGTIRNGNVFLNDNNGVTTGTIRNGNIFLNNSDGSMTIGSYTRTNIYTNTTAPPMQSRPTQPVCDANCGYQRNYEAGAAMGRALGTGIYALRLRHKLNSWCKEHPAGWVDATLSGVRYDCAKWNASHYKAPKPPPREVAKVRVSEQPRTIAPLRTEPSRGSAHAAPGPVESATVSAPRNTVRIVSDPEDVQIEVDGTFQGRTPAQVNLGRGTHLLRLTKRGFAAYEQRIELTDLGWKVAPAATVSRGDITLDGIFNGREQALVPVREGFHVLRVGASGWEQRIGVSDGELNLGIDLQRDEPRLANVAHP